MARGSTAPAPARPIQVTVGGKTVSGSYSLADRIITVAYLGRTETAQLGGPAAEAESLAKTMLAKMAGGARRGG